MVFLKQKLQSTNLLLKMTNKIDAEIVILI